MKHTFKIIASKAGKVVFDARVDAETPREAREKMREALGLDSLTGVVYAITEIPLELIREIVAEQIARIQNMRFVPAPSNFPAQGANAPSTPDTEPIRAILGPNWKTIRRHYEKTRSIKQTAAQFDVPVNTLKARIRRGGWGQ